MRQKASSTEKAWLTELILMAPILFAVAVLPFIMRLNTDTLNESSALYFTSGVDFFHLIKAQVLMVLAVAAIILTFFSKAFTLENLAAFKKDSIVLALGVYTIFVVLSATFSDYRDVAFHGLVQRFEGMYALLAYVCLWFVVFLQVRSMRQVKWVIGSLLVMLFFSAILGFSQFTGRDLLFSQPIMALIIPAEYIGVEDVIRSIAGNNIYLTLQNQNHVGSLFALIFVIVLGLFITAACAKFKLLYGMFTAFAFFVLVGSYSRGGLYGAIFGIVFLLVMLHRDLFAGWKSFVILSGVLGVVLVCMDIYADNTILPRIPAAHAAQSPNTPDTAVPSYYTADNILFRSGADAFTIAPIGSDRQFNIAIDAEGVLSYFDETGAVISPAAEQEGELLFVETGLPVLHLEVALPRVSVHLPEHDNAIHLRVTNAHTLAFASVAGEFIRAEDMAKRFASRTVTDFWIDGQFAVVQSGDSTLYLWYDGNVHMTDGANPIDTIQPHQDKQHTLISPGFEGFTVWQIDNVARVDASHFMILFYFDPSQSGIQIMSPTGKVGPLIENPPIFPLLRGRERLFTMRGYIWGRGIPLLAETLLIGHGPDTFIFYFPQGEHRAKFTYYNDLYHVVDKPHNMFLQMGINTGVVSLIAFLTAMAILFKRAVLSHWRGGKNAQVLMAICGGLLAFLAAGMVNDSTVGIAPIFWICFGTACAMVRNMVSGCEDF